MLYRFLRYNFADKLTYFGGCGGWGGENLEIPETLKLYHHCRLLFFSTPVSQSPNSTTVVEFYRAMQRTEQPLKRLVTPDGQITPGSNGTIKAVAASLTVLLQ